MKSENKNVLLAVLCTILVFLTLDYFFPKDRGNSSDTVKPASFSDTVLLDQTIPQIQESPIIKVESETLKGQIRLRGLVFDDLTFLKYKQTVEKNSPDVVLLNSGYFMSPVFKGKDIDLPNAQTVWQADKDTLTPVAPVTLTWTNNQGITFTRQISLDDKYMFKFSDSITAQNEPVSVAIGGTVYRVNPQQEGATSVHQGFVGVLDSKLHEEKYPSIESKQNFNYTSQGGWLGFGDKYWLSAFAFNPKNPPVMANVSFIKQQENKNFALSYETELLKVPANETLTVESYFFAGPKDLDLLDAYQDTLGIDRFELAIDFGWYYFLTKPFLRLLSWLYGLVGNMGIAILIFATVLRILMLPIASKSFESMAKMRKIQPRIQELQKRYKDDKLRLNQEMMLLYKKEKVSPASGCLPMFIQIPVFFSLYKVLSVSIEMRQAPFFGWIHDLSARDPSSIFTLFGLVPWPIPSMLNIGVWPLLMGITMYLQQKMSVQPTADSGQASDMAKAMRWMPIFFMFMMGNFASGLVIYWTWSNILGIIQQRYIMHKFGAK